MAENTPTLTCKQCNFVNEPERVYCHNCGTKLDRSVLPKDPPKVTEVKREKSAKRVQRMINPNRGFFTRWHVALANSLVSAISLAALIQIARPPASGIPRVPTKEERTSAPHLIELIEEVQMSPVPVTQQIPEDTINLYLANALRTRGDTTDDYFKFDRAFVNLGAGALKIVAQESAFGYPLYASASYKLSISGDKLVATNNGGALGRLPVHPMIMEYCGFAFDQIWAALSHEHSLLDKMQAVSVTPGAFVFTTRPHS